MAISPNSWKEVCPEEDVLPPRRKPSIRTRREMYLGSRTQMLIYAYGKLPPDQYEAFRAWIFEWVSQKVDEDA
jgi:hypothetical protein